MHEYSLSFVFFPRMPNAAPGITHPLISSSFNPLRGLSWTSINTKTFPTWSFEMISFNCRTHQLPWPFVIKTKKTKDPSVLYAQRNVVNVRECGHCTEGGQNNRNNIQYAAISDDCIIPFCGEYVREVMLYLLISLLLSITECFSLSLCFAYCHYFCDWCPSSLLSGALKDPQFSVLL